LFGRCVSFCQEGNYLVLVGIQPDTGWPKN